MNDFILQSELTVPAMPPRLAGGSSKARGHMAFQRLEDRQFLAMERAFLAHGGLASGNEMVQRLRRHVDQPLSALARWIVRRSIVRFEWQGNTLIPLFQFDVADMSVRATTAKVLSELVAVFDDWDLALWFAQPNSWLHDVAPIEAFDSDPLEVVHAARADHFVARG
jgi:hypothetical protein